MISSLQIVVTLKNLAGSALAGLSQTLRGIAEQALSLRTALAGIGLGIVARSFVQSASNAEQLRLRLKALTGDLASAAAAAKRIGEAAGAIGQTQEEAVAATITLAQALDGNVALAERLLPKVADLAAASGQSIEHVTATLGRAMMTGEVRAVSFGDRLVASMAGLRKGVEYTASDITAQLEKAWEDPASRFRGASAELSASWIGLTKGLSDVWDNFKQDVMDAGVFDFLKAAFSVLLEELGKLKASGEYGETIRQSAIVAVAALRTLIQAVALLGDAWRGLKLIWKGLEVAWASLEIAINHGIQGIVSGLKFLLQKFADVVGGLGRLLEDVPGYGALAAELQSIETGLYGTSGKLQGLNQSLDANAKFWDEHREAVAADIVELAKEESLFERSSKLIDAISANAEKRRLAREAPRAQTQARPAQAAAEAPLPQEARLKSELSRLQAASETFLLSLESEYERGLVSFEDYFDERERVMREAFEKEKALLLERARAEEAAKNPAAALGTRDEVFKLEQKYEQDGIKLARERAKAEEELAKQRLTVDQSMFEMRSRLQAGYDATMLEAQALEREEMTRGHEEEIRKLAENKATQAQIEQAHRLQQLELDKLAAEQRVAVEQALVSGVSSTLGTMEQAFGDAYEASGKKAKEFFYAQKAVAIVNTIVSTYEAAQNAFTSMSKIPYVGPALGIAAAAAAVAAGLARVALIRSQTLAAGGAVRGFSPNDRADNIPAMLTAGEFVQPVGVVRHYGLRAMEAIRQRAVPRELLEEFAGALPRPRADFAFAAGGQVPAPGGDSGNGAGKQTPPININNIIDPALMEQYVATRPGERNIMNVLSRNQFQLKQLVLGK